MSCSGSTPTRAPPRAMFGRGSARGSAALSGYGSDRWSGRGPGRGSGRGWARGGRCGSGRGIASTGSAGTGRGTGAAARMSAASALRLLGGMGVELVGQHAAAAFVGLDRHAALAAPGIGAHQGAPRPFMRAVDRQQLVRGRDRLLRVGLFAQQVLRQHAGPVGQPLALAGEPGVEGGIDPVQILQQVAVQQRQRPRPVRRCAQHLFDVDPDRAGPQHQMVATDRQRARADRRHRLAEPVDFLPQRGARLLVGAAAPEQFGHFAAQHRARRGQRQHRQQRPRFASGRQHGLAGERPGFHLADQAQTYQNRVTVHAR